MNRSFFAILPFLPLINIGGSFPREVSHWLDALFGICTVILIIIVLIFVLWVLSMLFGRGDSRG